MLDAEEAHDRAEQHHPLDAEIEHARALREELSQRGEEERRSVRDRRSEDDDDDAVVHDVASAAGADALRGQSIATR